MTFRDLQTGERCVQQHKRSFMSPSLRDLQRPAENSYNEYTTQQCAECGHLMYYQVHIGKVGNEWREVGRRGPSCWNADCQSQSRGDEPAAAAD
jgi:hypothetical protein